MQTKTKHPVYRTVWKCDNAPVFKSRTEVVCIVTSECDAFVRALMMEGGKEEAGVENNF